MNNFQIILEKLSKKPKWALVKYCYGDWSDEPIQYFKTKQDAYLHSGLGKIKAKKLGDGKFEITDADHSETHLVVDTSKVSLKRMGYIEKGE